MSHILRHLDKHRVLGFPIWEFSFKSLSRLYGRVFAWHIVLRHPLRTWQGILAYRRLFRQGRWQGSAAHLYAGTQADFRTAILEAEGRFLVALGFCQKPLGTPGGCPAGRFNHECYVLSRDDIREVPAARLPLPCRDCNVRAIGLAALCAGAAVYIMTSAADIARHLFIPALRAGRFRHGLFLQCPYSIPPMILPLLICSIQSLLVGYVEGDCRDYQQFLLADEGIKEERTALSPATQVHILSFLQSVALARQAAGPPPLRFQREGSLYVPAGSL